MAYDLDGRACLDAENMSVYSIDMIRLSIRTRPEDIDEIRKALDKWVLPFRVNTFTSNRVGGYRFLWVYDFEDSTVSVGYAHIDGSGKTDAGLGFVEYNPNKVGEQGAALVRYLIGYGVEVVPVRYDMAIDFPIMRDTVRVVKDGRKYGCEISDSMTEYLGQRNKPGRVKVYDKSAEAGLCEPLTRVELTCAAEWDVEGVKAKLPCVYSFNFDAGGLSRVTRAFAVAVMALVEKGDVAETWMRLVGSKTATKIRRALRSGVLVRYDDSCIENIVGRVCRWGDECESWGLV